MASGRPEYPDNPIGLELTTVTTRPAKPNVH